MREASDAVNLVRAPVTARLARISFCCVACCVAKSISWSFATCHQKRRRRSARYPFGVPRCPFFIVPPEPSHEVSRCATSQRCESLSVR